MVTFSSYILHIQNLHLFTITNYSPKYKDVITTELNLEFYDGREQQY
jgi:hypothetical protein